MKISTEQMLIKGNVIDKTDTKYKYTAVVKVTTSQYREPHGEIVTEVNEIDISSLAFEPKVNDSNSYDQLFDLVYSDIENDKIYD